MAVQPALPPTRRPLPRRVDTRRRRIDPPNTFQTALPFAREAERPDWIETTDPALTHLPSTPLAADGAVPASPTLSRSWAGLLAASVALHVAVAAFFLLRSGDEEVLIAGADEAGVVILGDGPADQLAAGEVTEATNVTIVTMLDARPVETIDASEVATAEALQPVTETLTEAPVAERLEPAAADRVEAAVADSAAQARPETLAEVAPAAAAAAVVEDTAVQTPVTDTLPEILSTDTPEVVAEEDAVAPAAPTQAAAPAETAETITETAAATPAEQVQPDAPQPTTAEALQPARIETLLPAESDLLPPAPEPPAVAEAPQPVEKRPEPPKPQAKKAEAKKPAPARKTEAKKAAGDGGSNKVTARRGKVDGEANGTRADKAGKGKASSAGNADVTNYPGKVVSKLKRALRRVPGNARRSADRDVHVAFTVTTSGGLGGVSITRSSGSAALDKAALDAVRRAAPFPPIPDGRQSWRFSFPLGLK